MSGRTVAPAAPKTHRASTEEAADEAALNKLIVSILEESADTDGMYASELKGILLRLRPDFNEKSYGCSSFGKLLTKLSQRFGELRVKNDNFNMMVNLNSAESAEGRPQLTKENGREAFAAQLHPMLLQIHGRVQHAGRKPLQSETDQRSRYEQEELTRQLQMAVNAED